MHEPRVIADKQRATAQAGGDGRQLRGADQIDEPVSSECIENRLGNVTLGGGAKNSDPRAGQYAAIGRRQAPREFGKVIRRPNFTGPVRCRTQGENRAAFELVDVREPFEWGLGVIEGARLVSLGDLLGRIGEFYKDRDLVFICEQGLRSATAAALFAGRGYARASSVAEGFGAWFKAGHPVVE